MSSFIAALRTGARIVAGVAFVAAMMAVMLVFPFAFITRSAATQVSGKTDSASLPNRATHVPRTIASAAC